MERFKISDGAMGTMLQKKGLKPGRSPELMNLTAPDEILAIHRAYTEAGAELLYANTFGANERKLRKGGFLLEEVIHAGISIARKAAEETGAMVALDMGPLGELLEPAGGLSFEEAYRCFKRTAIAGEKAGADLAVIETFTDLYEVKAAVLAVRENTSLPVMVSMTFEENGRTFTGCSIEAMAALLEGLRVDAVGINCSLGPDQIFPLAERLLSCTTLPVFVKPNAGLPDPETGEYRMTPEEFAESMKRYAIPGIFMVGGCCGTTPRYIRELKKTFEAAVPEKRQAERKSVVSTSTRTVTMEDVTVVGERINPTGKPLLREALTTGDLGYLLREAVMQTDAGADILDVNVGAPGIEEKVVLPEVVKRIQAVTDLPLQLDSSDPEALEAGLRVYNGKPVVNSVNGRQDVMDAVFPLVKKYGAAVVGLTLDEDGIPKTVEKRVEIAEKIVREAEKYGIPREDILIDCLTLTVSAEQDQAQKTLDALKIVKEKLGVKTLLGVSNISFGLPNRELLNKSFLLMGLQNGMDLAIINPMNEGMMDTIRAYRVLTGKDRQSSDYIGAYRDYVPEQASKEDPGKKRQSRKDRKDGGDDVHELILAIRDGLSEEAEEQTEELLKEQDPMVVISQYLIPALDLAGELYEKGSFFLPQLLQSANAAKKCFELVKRSFPEQQEATARGPIVLATVEGDIHDIGKNIVKVILENYGYRVIDLGNDVAKEKVVEAVKRSKAPLVGLSALMTTTLKNMEKTISALHEAGCDCQIMAGGAVLTPEYARKIGADFYAEDATGSVEIARKVIGT